MTTQNTLYEFTSEDSFELKDRGTVYTFSGWQIPEEMVDPNVMQGTWVLIDGKKQYIAGVETFCVYRGPDRPYRMGFGLLVGDGNKVKSIKQS